MPRVSNRKYPKRKCENPSCAILYVPHDKRQTYCEEQCRINWNNDKRSLENNTKFAAEKQLRTNNKILNQIWGKLKQEKQKLVNSSLLKWEKFVFESQTCIQNNSKTNRPIIWYHDFGLELIDPAKK